MPGTLIIGDNREQVLLQLIMELENRVAMIEALAQVKREQDLSAVDDRDDAPASYLIVPDRATGLLSLKILQGNRVVIHFSADHDNDQPFTIADASTTYFWTRYVYGVGWDASFSSGSSYPAEATTYRLFRIGWARADNGRLIEWHNDHVGDLETYKLRSC